MVSSRVLWRTFLILRVYLDLLFIYWSNYHIYSDETPCLGFKYEATSSCCRSSLGPWSMVRLGAAVATFPHAASTYLHVEIPNSLGSPATFPPSWVFTFAPQNDSGSALDWGTKHVLPLASGQSSNSSNGSSSSQAPELRLELPCYRFC